MKLHQADDMELRGVIRETINELIDMCFESGYEEEYAEELEAGIEDAIHIIVNEMYGVLGVVVYDPELGDVLPDE